MGVRCWNISFAFHKHHKFLRFCGQLCYIKGFYFTVTTWQQRYVANTTAKQQASLDIFKVVLRMINDWEQ